MVKPPSRKPVPADGAKGGARAANGLPPLPPPRGTAHPAYEAWLRGYRFLPMMLPRFGFTPDRWREICHDCGDVIGWYGQRLAALGWTEQDLFGIDILKPLTPDGQGLAIRLAGGDILKFGSRQATIRTGSGSTQAVRVRRLTFAVPIRAPLMATGIPMAAEPGASALARATNGVEMGDRLRKGGGRS